MESYIIRTHLLIAIDLLSCVCDLFATSLVSVRIRKLWMCNRDKHGVIMLDTCKMNRQMHR